MTGDGPPNDPTGRSTEWSGDGAVTPPAPTKTNRIDGDDGGLDPTGDAEAVDELQARLDHTEASLQDVIDQYESVLQSRRDEGRTMGESGGFHEGLVDSARTRLDRLLTDVKILIDPPRR